MPSVAAYRQLPSARPSLAHFVFLSILLHTLFIVLFGAPAGGSREGRAMWGALNVLLSDPVPIPGPSLRMDRGLGAVLPEVAPAEKKAGVRESPPSPRPIPAAPALELSPAKEIAPQPITPPVTSVSPPAPPPPVEVPPPAEPVPVQAEPAPPPAPRVEPLPVQPLFAPIPRLDRTVVPELRPEIPPTYQAPPLDNPAPALPAPPPPPPAAAPAPAPPAPPAPAPIERPMPPRVELPPAEAPPLPAPLVQPAPIVQPAPPTPPAPPAPPVERPPALPAEQLPTPPVERAPIEAPPVPVLPAERVTPPKVEPSSRPSESAPPREPLRPPPTAIERAEPRVPERESPTKGDPAAPREPAPRGPAIAPPERSPGLFGAPRDSLPSASDPTKGPGIDLDAARRRARELAREGSGNRALLPFPMPPPPEHKTKEQIAIEKARKPDCKTAYKDLGLLAVVPLVANEFGEGNCRW